MNFLTDIEKGLFHKTYKPLTYMNTHFHPESRIIVEVDARPLEVLAEAAALGFRVYELMSIQRIGDILYYLELNIVDINSRIQNMVNSSMNTRGDSKPDYHTVPYRVFDSLFEENIYFAETYEAENWLGHRESSEWKQYLTDLLRVVRVLQKRLRGIDDFLLKHEINLIDNDEHEFDLLDEVTRDSSSKFDLDALSPLPGYLLELISDLITRDDVRTVSCHIKDHRLWRIFTTEQIKRVERTGQPHQEVFGICGIDGRNAYQSLSKQWGGEIHSPYEGVCPSDLFIQSGFCGYDPFVMESTKQLCAAYGPCRYYLTQIDHGELDATIKTTHTDWFLYESTAVYKPNDWNIPKYDIPERLKDLGIEIEE